jgi:hypothetical protein
MHKSRLAGFIIDCQGAGLGGTPGLVRAADFWGQALGLPVLGEDGPGYVRLDGGAHQLVIEVQAVDHESRVHLDIESDDVEAEVGRLEALGARRVEKIRTFWVMQAPTGQRFCVVQAQTELQGRPGTQQWP